jgi:hypothetical protein
MLPLRALDTSLKGKFVMVTGANQGLGFQTAQVRLWGDRTLEWLVVASELGFYSLAVTRRSLPSEELPSSSFAAVQAGEKKLWTE